MLSYSFLLFPSLTVATKFQCGLARVKFAENSHHIAVGIMAQHHHPPLAGFSFFFNKNTGVLVRVLTNAQSVRVRQHGNSSPVPGGTPLGKQPSVKVGMQSRRDAFRIRAGILARKRTVKSF